MFKMKKIIISIVVVFVLSLGVYAQRDGFFNSWEEVSYRDDIEDTDMPVFPNSHDITENINLPLGNGILILTMLGAGYVIRKKRS